MSHLPRRARPRHGAIALAATGLAFSLIAAGCTSAVGQQDKAGSTPSRGGTLRIVQGADVQPATLMSQNNPNFSLDRMVFNSLIQYDHKTLAPQPELATAWRVSPDGKTYTFTLRTGVTFHDGRAFTAADVIADLKIIQRPEVASQVKGIANQIATMTAQGADKVVITFKTALSNVFDLFLMMPVIDPASAGDLFAGKRFNGTGPFVVQKYTPGQGFRLTRRASSRSTSRRWTRARSRTTGRTSSSSPTRTTRSATSATTSPSRCCRTRRSARPSRTP